MTITIEGHDRLSSTGAQLRIAGPAFVLAGIAFLIGGATHPTDSGEGNKVLQLHEMLVDPSWYPSHALLLVAMALFATGIFAYRQRRALTPGMATVLKYAFVIACIVTVSMTVHLFAALGADSLAEGEHSLMSRVQTVNEIVVQGVWALSIAALAFLGGLTRTVGNRLTIPFGLVGGVAFAIASATVPYTDTFDSLFKVGSLIAVWAILTGVLTIRQHADGGLEGTRTPEGVGPIPPANRPGPDIEQARPEGD